MENIKLFSGDYNISELYNLIKDGYVLSNTLYDNKKLINDISTLETNKYREFMNELIKNNFNFALRLEKYRIDYVKNQINLIDEDGIFKYLYNMDSEELKKILSNNSIRQLGFVKNEDDIKRILKMYTDKCLFEYIIDLYFKEIAYNFLSNLKNMLRYVNNIQDDIIPKERLKFYKDILNFHNLDIKEQKQLFNSYDSNINYIENFYDDFSNCKKNSYKRINDNIINSEELNKLYNKNLSNEYGLNIYELDKEPFYLYAHVSKLDSDVTKFPFKKSSNRTISLSLIGDKNIGTYNPPFEHITLGFKNLKPENVIHLFNSDSYTAEYKSSNKIQKIYTPDNLLLDTYGYNEILYSQTEEDNLYPSYIICFDEIRDIDLYFAKKENLPIIKINTLHYRKSGIIEDSMENKYRNADETKNISSYRMM